MRWTPLIAVGARLLAMGLSGGLAYSAARHGHFEAAAIFWFTVQWLMFSK